jgi:hypothetical protein
MTRLRSGIVRWSFGSGGRRGRLRGFAFGAEIVDEVFDFVRLEGVPEGRHAAAALADLALDTVLVPALADGGEIGSAVGADAVDAVAVLAALVVEGRGPGGAGLVREGADRRDKKRDREDGEATGGRQNTGDGSLALEKEIRGFFAALRMTVVEIHGGDGA